MAVQNICTVCAAPIPANAPQGFCPNCLLNMGMRAVQSSYKKSQPQRSRDRSKSIVGDYELLEEIARGGMGVVFRARQLSLNRIVAVKALLFGEFASDEFIARFRAEAQAVAALHHDSIVAIHDIWEHRGQHFFSMEFIEGQTLAQLLKTGPLNRTRAAELAETIARAIHFAHERGIIHRDLKPSNILLDELGHPHVTDFGLAKRLTSRDAAAPSGNIVGSPHYMSPEQSGQRNVPVGPASDIYSIGAILYHMLSGRPAFVGETIEEILAQTQSSEPISPRLLSQNVPRDLETICLRCLYKDPRRRYASALDLAEDLRRFLAHRPILARPITPFERAVRWIRRNPAPTAVLALLTAIATSATWASVHFQQLNREVRIGQYVSDMSVAMRHIEDGDLGHAAALLKAHVRANNSADIRGFEWRHMWQVCRGNFEDWLPTHPQVVGALQFTSDGAKALTFAWNATARIWNPRTRANSLTLKDVSAIGGFTVDEKSFVANRTDGSIQIIDATTGKTNRVFQNVGELVAYSRQAETAVSRQASGRLAVWKLSEAHEILVISNAPPAKLNYSWNSPVTISADATKLAIISPSANPLLPAREVRVWNLRTGFELSPLPENRELRCLNFSPDGTKLITGDGQGKIRVWDIPTHSSTDIDAHKVPVLSIAFSPDGKTFATGSSDRHPIRLWDLETLTPLENEFRGQAGDVWCLAFSSDGKRLASGTRDDVVRIWNIDTATPERPLARLHADEYANFAFSPDSQLIAGGCEDNTVKIWNVATLQLVAAIPRASYVVAFSTDSERLLASTKDGRAFWWNLKTKTSEKLPNYRGNLNEVVCVAISPNRRFAALGLANGQIRLVNMGTGLPARQAFEGHSGPVRSLAFSPDGRQLASGGSDMNVMVWDVQTGARIGACEEHKAAVYGVAISPNGKVLASGCGAETIKLWDLNDVTKHSWFSTSVHRSVIRSLSFTPDMRTLASGSEDRTLKLWNFFSFVDTTMRREVASFTFDDPLRAVQFSPDGNTLAAVTDKGRLQLFHAYSLEESDRQVAELR